MVDKKFCIEYFLTGISEKAINGDKIHKYDREHPKVCVNLQTDVR